MNFKRHFEVGWQNTLKFIGPVILLTFVQLIVTIITLGIMGPVTSAGYIKSLLLASREGRTPDVQDLFSEMSLFLPLFGFSVAVILAIGFGLMLLVIPAFFVSIFIAFSCLYIIPLMIDRRLGVIEALKASWEMATRRPLADQAIITIVFLALISLGSSVLLAILITQPLATFILLSVYEERLGSQSEMPPPIP